MNQAALQISNSGGSWSLAWDCRASPRNYNYKRYYQPRTGRYLSVDPVRDGHDYAYVNNNPLRHLDPFGLFSEVPFLQGFADAALGAGVGLAVGGAIAYLAPAALAPALPALGVVAAAYGGWKLGQTLYEFFFEREWTASGGGSNLCDEAVSYRAGQALFGAVSVGLMASKWGKLGTEQDAEWLRMSGRERYRADLGQSTIRGNKFREVQSLPPGERDISLTDLAPWEWINTYNTGPTPAGRYAFPFGLSGSQAPRPSRDAE